jgi:hypothetical protein
MVGNVHCLLDRLNKFLEEQKRATSGRGWGRERDDVACVVVARSLAGLWNVIGGLGIIPREVVVTSHGAANRAVSGCTNFAHSVRTTGAYRAAGKS